MPIYEYRCDDCGARSSALLPSYASADPPCPGCGSTRVSRLVSSFATARSEGEDLGGHDLGGQDLGGLEGGDGAGWGGSSDGGDGWDGGGLDDDF